MMFCSRCTRELISMVSEKGRFTDINHQNLCKGEIHIDSGKYMMRNSKLLTKAAEHDRPFRPAKYVRLSHNAAFDHLTDYKEIKKNFRNEDGEVVIPPRNI